MDIDRSASPPDPRQASEAEPTAERAARRLTTAIGLGALAVGAVVLARLVWWFGEDMGWDGSGSSLRDPWVAGILCAAAVGAVVLATTTLVVGRRRPPGSGGRWLVTLTAVVGALVPLTLAVYPNNSPAVLSSVSAAEWKVTLPLTEVLGYRSQSDTQIVLEGRADERHCAFSLRAVTLDLGDGTIRAVDDLPTTYPDASQVPAPPAPLDPARFRVDQGSSPVVCSS